ncbi:hypothetical protein [Paenibacillus sp. Leaf72]|uniref:hypothetical protein n=1 Tax=Paenibacillus sp. Leaf72 TaxID=1736234 RepID=UPI0012DF30E9|nr:hypothetical protein [Paenibacillus sp. Leaf72]
MARQSKKKTTGSNKAKKKNKKKTKKIYKKKIVRRVRKRHPRLKRASHVLQNQQVVPTNDHDPAIQPAQPVDKISNLLSSLFVYPRYDELPPIEEDIWERVFQAAPNGYKIPDVSIVQSLL